MKILKKHSKIINRYKILILTAVVFFSCGRKDQREDFVARVEDSYLTENQISELFNNTDLIESKKYEFISNWIETELLYKEAVKNDITENKDYIRILEQSQKELANALLIKKILSEAEIKYKDENLLNFYNEKKEDFKLFEDAYLFNIIKFSDEDKAILFRNTLIESDWNKANNVFRGDPDVISSKSQRLLTSDLIQPVEYITVLDNLLPLETSIVLNFEPDNYVILQSIRKYNKYSIPEFKLVKEKVRQRYLMLQKNELIENYLKELYSKYSVEIKQSENLEGN